MPPETLIGPPVTAVRVGPEAGEKGPCLAFAASEAFGGLMNEGQPLLRESNAASRL